MYTKIKNILCSSFYLLVTSLVFVSCTNEDTGVGFSTLTPNAGVNVSISVTGGTSFNVNDGVETEIPFTVTLSQAQVVNTVVQVFQTSGDAEEGSDFSLSAPEIVIPAYSTSASGSIKILKDDLKEDTETFAVQIGDQTTANASLTPVDVNVTINNFTDGDLAVDLSWAMHDTTTDSSGEEIEPVDFADMILRISTTPNDSGDIDEKDGAGFEGLVLPSDTPDGTYYVSASFWSANEDIVRDLDLTLTLNQTGTINDQVMVYEKAINNLGTCDLNYYVMTKIIKSGNSYTFEDVSTQSYDLSMYTEWSGTDATDAFVGAHPSEVITKPICGGIYIKGLNASWILNSWGEEVQEGAPNVFATVASDGTLTIKSQFLFTTLYDGDLYDYTVSGTGMLDMDAGTLHIEYSLDQDGFSPNEWMFDNGYMSTDVFVADLTQ